MIVTVKERTREIGIRRALGAKLYVIIIQIMSERLLLILIADMMGICSGVLFQYLAGILFLQNADIFMSNPIISFNTAVLSTIILLIFGLFAG